MYIYWKIAKHLERVKFLYVVMAQINQDRINNDCCGIEVVG